MHQTTEFQKCEAKLIELKEEMDKSAIKIKDCNILFSTIDRTTRWKISKDILSIKRS